MTGNFKWQYLKKDVWRKSSNPINSEGKVKKSICGLCHGGCGLKVLVDNEGKIKAVYGDWENPYNLGHICPKPIESAQILNSPYRVRYPLKKQNGSFQRITWEEALKAIAEHYNRVWKEYGNSSVVGITSKIGGSYSKFALSIFSKLTGLVTYGTGPICYLSEQNARKSLLGSASTPNPLWDVINSKIVLLVGHNWAQTKGGQFHWVQKARQNGAKVVVIDTRYTATAQNADQFIQIKPGTDGALGLALLHVIIKENLYDKQFVDKHINGFEGLSEAVKKYLPQEAEKITGVPAAVIIDLARDLGKLKPGIFFGGRGIACVSNAAGSFLAYETLMAILGNIGKPGGGIISHLMGYGSAQGLIADEDVVKPDKKRAAHELYPAMEEGEIKLLFIAGNPCVTWPDSERMRRAIRNVDLVVSHSLVLDDSAQEADIVLPACHWFEVSGAQHSSNRVFQWRDAVVEPVGEAKPAGDLFRELAKQMGLNSSYFPANPEEAWEMERKHNPAISGITIKGMKSTPGGIPYPCKEGEKPRERLYEDHVFPTSSGKIELKHTKTLGVEYPYYENIFKDNSKREIYPFILNTAKVPHHYHTQCQYSIWAKELGGPYLEMHPETAKKVGVKDKERIVVETESAKISLPVSITSAVLPDNVVTQPYYGKCSPFKMNPINSLFKVAIDPIGGGFVQKNIPCKVYKEEAGEGEQHAICNVN